MVTSQTLPYQEILFYNLFKPVSLNMFLKYLSTFSNFNLFLSIHFDVLVSFRLYLFANVAVFL